VLDQDIGQSMVGPKCTMAPEFAAMREVLDGAHTHLKAKEVSVGISFSLDGMAHGSVELRSVVEKLKAMMTAQE
jgi:hypothetical protein